MLLFFNIPKVFAQAGQKWATGGNNISNGDYLGTKNAIDLDFKVNQALQLKITTVGEVIVQDKLIVNNGIKSNYLAGNGFALLQADNNGNIQPFSFPADSNVVLFGNGTWGNLLPDNGWKVNGNDMFAIPTGNVGIGTTDTHGFKLAVNGSMIAEDVTVQLYDNWVNYPDFVFSNNYKMMDLSNLEKYIKKNNHLPGIPTAEEVSETGLKLGEMNQKLLQKVEELTLYIIEQNKEISRLKEEIQTMKKQY